VEYTVVTNKDITDKPTASVISLTPKDCKLRESAGNIFRIIVPIGTPKERLMESSFYSVISHLFFPFDELILIGADRTFHARFLVLQAGAGYCEVHQLSYTELPAMLASIGETLPSNHRLVYNGPDELWSAIRNSDGVVIIRNAKSQQEALQELLQHASLRQ
jgi:hypothetical protein